VPKKQIDDQVPLFIGAASARAMMNSVAAHHPGMTRPIPPDEDPWIRVTRLRRARTRSAHASCWSAGDVASVGPQADDELHPANRSTIRRLPLWSPIASPTVRPR